MDLLSHHMLTWHEELVCTSIKIFLLFSLVYSVRTRSVARLTAEIQQPNFPTLIHCFLYDQIYPDNVLSSSEVPLSECPSFNRNIRIHNSAVATFHAPSDPSRPGGMCQECIRAVPSWRKGPAHYDCVFLNSNPDVPGMLGMDVVQVHLFF